MTGDAPPSVAVEGSAPAPGRSGSGAPVAPRVVREVGEARRAARALRRQRGSLALVPTMGFLHEGHLSLLDRARELADAVAISVFVNPTQFGPGEDYETYPRDLERDAGLAAARGAELVFAPTADGMYPSGSPTITVDPGPLAERLCGLGRPGHFRGVLTVVLKLLHVLEPDVAVFGRKDFQQSVLVRRMTEELDLPTRIETAPIVREPSGLAMSSRNAYLSPSERRVARSLSQGLRRVRERFAAGERDPAALASLALAVMEAAGAEVEYAEVVDPRELAGVHVASAEDVCAVAARVGSTRLIDNASLGGESSLDAVGRPAESE
jgi:pantoate--beta-alanine ligase